MKAITRISFLITWIFFTYTISAQRPHHGPRMGGEGVIWEQLDLSEAQQDAISIIRKEHREAMIEIRSDQDLEQEEKRAAVKKLAEDFKAKVGAELTEDQKVKLAEHKEEMDQKMEDHRSKKQAKQATIHETIMPKLIEIRKDFDKKISKTDQATIADLQAQHRSLRKSGAERKSKNHKPGFGKLQETPSQKWRGLTEEQKVESQEMAQALKSLVVKYYDDIHDVFETNQSLFEELRENLRPDKEQEGRHIGRASHKMQRKEISHRTLFSPEIRFLLMPMELDDAAFPKQGIGNNMNSNLKVFPNPSNERIRIEYAVDSKGPVHIQVLDQNGTQLKSFPQGVKSTGDYIFNLENLNLNSGTYIVQVISKTGETSQKIIITK